MRIYADYHTHSRYSDGKSGIEDIVKAAVMLGLSEIGISDHSYKHITYGISKENFYKSGEEIRALKKKYPQIKILHSIECNIINDEGILDIDDDMLKDIDYLIAGYHYAAVPTGARSIKNTAFNFIKPLGRFEKEYNTLALIHAMERNNIDILAHPGDKEIVDIEAVAEAAVRTNTALEINERHHNLTVNQLLITKNYDLKYVVSSDAHTANAVGKAKNALLRVLNAGINPKNVINIGGAANWK